ncbi:hypothetical protein [Xenorhabdus bharatensis]|uniref:hypothetical protein n=1 Tax=Xenorhabdus bharatensis TaxID=3136256 RepID=UPI0030F46D4D
MVLFFLSTSYVTHYIEQEGGELYFNEFMRKVIEIGGTESVAVNFDIHAVTAVNR